MTDSIESLCCEIFIETFLVSLKIHLQENQKQSGDKLPTQPISVERRETEINKYEKRKFNKHSNEHFQENHKLLRREKRWKWLNEEKQNGFKSKFSISWTNISVNPDLKRSNIIKHRLVMET